MSATLGEVAALKGLIGGPFGSNLVKADYVEDGVPVIRGQNLGLGRWVDFGNCVYVSQAKVNADLSRNLATAGDLIFTQRGTLGQVAIVPLRYSGSAVISQSQMRLRVNPDVADPLFIYYCASAPDFLDQIKSSAIVSGVPHINLGILSRLTIPLPPLDEQRRIAGVLGALDDLIEVDRGLVDQLDTLRRILSAEVLDRADRSCPLSSIARFVNGKNFTKQASGSGRPVIRTPELRQGPNQGTVWNDVDASTDFVAQQGDTLFVWSGSLMVDRWIHTEGLVNQHIFKVISNDGIPDWLVFALIEHQMPWFLGLAADKATTMGHIQRAHLDDAVPMPSPEALNNATATISPLWDAQLNLRLEMLDLARIREELLPLLISGRVRVEDVAA